MRSSSIEVVLAQISSFGTFPGGWGWVGGLESIIRLISVEAEAEALLGLAELGNINLMNSCKILHIVNIEENEKYSYIASQHFFFKFKAN